MAKKAAAIAKYLASNHLSHNRAITVERLSKEGVKIKKADVISKELSDALEDLHITYLGMFDRSEVLKIFENSNGQTLVLVLKQ